MGTWHNPEAFVVIKSAVDLVEIVVVVEVPPPAFAIYGFNVISPIPVPVGAIAAVARLKQDSEDTAVPKAMLLRQQVGDGRPERGQLAVLKQWSLVQLASIDRLQPLRLWVCLPSQGTCSNQYKEPWLEQCSVNPFRRRHGRCMHAARFLTRGEWGWQRTRHICNGAQSDQQWVRNGAFKHHVALGTELGAVRCRQPAELTPCRHAIPW